MPISYLDNSSTTRVSENAAKKAYEVMIDTYGNPASLHELGMVAEREMENARRSVAKRLSCEPSEVIFTSGGTESNNLALLGAAEARKRAGRKIITTSIEHPSVLSAAKELEKRGFEVVFLPVGSDGKIRISDLEKELDDSVILVSIMLVNNETGSVQPVSQAVNAVRQRCPGALVHTDAVQAFGKMNTNVKRLGVDLLSLSGHKIHAPKGVGALYIKKSVRIAPINFGGGQENKLRSGTPAVPNIAALGIACDEIPDISSETERVKKLHDAAANGIIGLDGIKLNGPDDALPYILNFSLEGVPSEVMIHFLEQKGVYVSGGSACSKGARSHVLEAQGLDGSRIDSAVRVSFSHYNTLEDVDALVGGVAEGYKILRRQGKHR